MKCKYHRKTFYSINIKITIYALLGFLNLIKIMNLSEIFQSIFDKIECMSYEILNCG